MSTSTRSRRFSVNSTQGFVHLSLIPIALVLVAVLVSTNLPVNREFASNVQGVSTYNMEEAKEVRVEMMEGRNVVVEKDLGAISSFPVKFDSKTNLLTITTASGEKAVATLPEAAISAALTSRVITEIESSDTSGSLGSLSKVVALEEKDGNLVYRISGQRKNLVLGLIPIKTPVTVLVSAETGQVIESQQSLLGRILNRISKAAD